MFDLSPYRGRWVAISGDDVIAIGETAETVYDKALASDPAENFFLVFAEDPAADALPFAALLDQALPILAARNSPVYLVGGAVRDALLGRVSHDFDFVVPRNAVSLTFRVANTMGAPAYVLDGQRDTGRIVLPLAETMLDIARYRGSDLFADLRDRDFTINSLAMPATARTSEAIIDPTGGLADLKAGRIRLTHAGALQDDSVRTLRAVRLAADMGYYITPETETAVRAAAPLLHEASPERVRDELLKIMQTRAVEQALLQMEDLGLLAVVLPEAAALAPVPQSPPHHEPVLQHTISVLRWLVRLEDALFAEDTAVELFADFCLASARTTLNAHREALNGHLARAIDGGVDGRVILRLAALFHDVGKPATMSVDETDRYRFFGHAEVGASLTAQRLRALSFSNDAIAQTQRIVSEHMRPLMLVQSLGARPSRRAAFRYFKATGVNGLDVGLLALADHLATHDGPGEESSWHELLGLVDALFTSYFNHHDEAVKLPMLVNGRDLMQHLNLPPGPEIGRLLSLIEEYQAAGELETRQEALLFAARFMA